MDKVAFPDDAPGTWQFRMLGSFEVTRGQRALPKLRSKTANALLAFLALHPGREFTRPDLAATFWPDSDGDRQMQNARRCLSDIRYALEGEEAKSNVLMSIRDHSGLKAASMHSDVGRFRELMRESANKKGSNPHDSLKEAVEIYAGPLLPAMSEYCFVPIRMELEEQYAQAVVKLCEHLCEASPGEATALGRRAVQCAPLREDLHIALIWAYIKSGMPSEAVRQFEELERILGDQFGEGPSEAAIAALESIPRASVTRVKVPATFDRYVVLLSATPALPFALDFAVTMNEHGVGVAFMRDDRSMGDWARGLERQIADSSAVVALVRPQDMESEALIEQCELAQRHGDIPLLAVSLEGTTLVGTPLGHSLRSAEILDASSPKTAAELILDSLRRPIARRRNEPTLELSGGSVPLDSPYYIERDADAELLKCMSGGEGVILIKGPRQIGKTSLTARAMAWARGHGYKTALCDFQTVNMSQLSSDQGLYRVVGHRFAKDLGVPFDWQGRWSDWLGPNDNLEVAIEHVLSQTEGPVLWAMDEVDRLFGQPFANDFFGLLRGWYNRRTLEPDGPWRRLTLLITYATEAHLFITDLNQSPFNIGVRLELDDFTPRQVADLNERYGSPLASEEDVLQLHGLTGGHPYLARRAYDWLVTTQGSISDLDEFAANEVGPFGDHLRRLLLVISRDKGTLEEVGRVIRGEEPDDERTVYDLTAGGLLRRGSPEKPLFRSPVYRRWLEARLPQTPTG